MPPLPVWLEYPDRVAPLITQAQARPLSKYERTVVIGTMAAQHAHGAPARVAGADPSTPLTTAAREYDAGLMAPMRVFRHMPDGTVVVRHVDQIREPQRRVSTWAT